MRMEESMNRTILGAVALILMASPATALERGPGLGGSLGGDHQAGQDRGDRSGGGRDRDLGGFRFGGRDRNLSGFGGRDRNLSGFSTGRSFNAQQRDHSGRGGDRN
jgi:opacity protein-like surface antigen